MAINIIHIRDMKIESCKWYFKKKTETKRKKPTNEDTWQRNKEKWSKWMVWIKTLNGKMLCIFLSFNLELKIKCFNAFINYWGFWNHISIGECLNDMTLFEAICLSQMSCKWLSMSLGDKDILRKRMERVSIRRRRRKRKRARRQKYLQMTIPVSQHGKAWKA